MNKDGFYLLIVSLLIAVIILSSFYYLFYKPQQNELLQIRDKIKKINAEILSQENTIAKNKEAIANMELGSVNLNFFNTNGIKGADKIPFFLKMINENANKLGIRFISITPNLPEDKGNYIKESFEIHIKTDFNKLIAFLYQIQNIIGLNIDRLIIMAGEEEQVSETLSVIGLNTPEMVGAEDKKIKTLNELRRFHLDQYVSLEGLEIGSNKRKRAENLYVSLVDTEKDRRDPFIKPQNIKHIQENLKRIEKELKESKLLGVIDFEGQKHAIIGRQSVKKGDKIFNMEVQEITSDTVILGDSGLKFTYQIKKNKNNLIK